MTKTIVTLSAILIIIGCATRKSKPTTTTNVEKKKAVLSTEEKAVAAIPNYTMESFKEGKTLYEANCGTCHALKNPLSEVEPAWKEIVPDMVKKVNQKGGTLDAAKEDLILKYVVSMTRTRP
jgi:cytochrome c5